MRTAKKEKELKDLTRIKRQEYYTAVSIDYITGKRYLTVSDDVDGLPCEALADPAPGVYHTMTTIDAIYEAYQLADRWNCDYLEWNTTKRYWCHPVNTKKEV